MNNGNNKTVRPELQDDIIELGVASVETLGIGDEGEGFGEDFIPGISAE